jgi:O-acetylhomoserine (thiol)-lyase
MCSTTPTTRRRCSTYRPTASSTRGSPIPTVAALEEKIASLEGGRGATCAATGHAAQILALFPLIRPGDRFVSSQHLYGGSVTQFGKTFQRFAWHVDFVDSRDLGAVRAAIGPRTKAIFVETVSNPACVVADLEPLAEIARAAGIPLIVDNTLPSPYLCRPIEWGADLIVHSTTKFLSGNGTTMGGALVDSGLFDWSQGGKFPALSDPEPAYHGIRFHESFGDLAFTTHAHAVGLRDLGASLAPQNAFYTLLGTETLSLRMDRHCQNAMAVASWLERHALVEWVAYPGLPSSPDHELAKKYLPKGCGSVYTFGIRGGYDAAVRFVESCELFSHLANLGDTRSLTLHPASTTHRQLDEEQRRAAGVSPEAVRLSIGLESLDDILADLDQALRRAAG